MHQRGQKKGRETFVLVETIKQDQPSSDGIKSDITGFLTEHESKLILESVGIKTTRSALAVSEDEAAEISAAIGFPVVLKVVSREIVHKSDSGGVRLNVRDEKEVRSVYREIMSKFREYPSAVVSVQQMAAAGIETIIGITRDADFGPVLMFGLGGIFSEVLNDATFRVLPVKERSIYEMIEEIKGCRLLKGYRSASADIVALKDLLVKVSDLAIKNPEIRELDLNPVIVYPSGYLVVDARIRIDRPTPVLRERESTNNYLHEMFYPESIAVLGASDSPGKLGYNVMTNLLNHKFPGKLFPVNARKHQVLGLRSYSSILDIEEPVDEAIVIVPAGAVPAAIEDCCKKEVKFIIVESAGFAETGAEGRKIQSHIKELIEKTGCRLLGPNCSGLINTHHNMVQSIGAIGTLRKGTVGLIAQAGVYAAGILTGLRKIVDFGVIATIGNKMDVDEVEILEFMGRDPNIEVIGLYMEDVSGGRRFLRAAENISRKKPVIVLKSGRTEEGKKGVSSHTASMAGNDAVNNAAFRQANVIRARDNEHLFSLIRGFSKQPLPKSQGVLVITYSGSLGVAATDMIYSNKKLRLAELEPQLKENLAAILDSYLNIQNPIDCSFTMDAEKLKDIIEICLKGEDVGSFIVVVQGEKLQSYVDAITRIDFNGKPVFCCVACKEFMMDDVISMEQKGIPVYSTPEMAVEVAGEMYQHKLDCDKAELTEIDELLAIKTFRMNNCEARFRLLTRHDTEVWTEFVNSCSQRSLWLRFLSAFAPTADTAERFCNINVEQEIAIIAEVVEADRKKVIGIGRLIKNRKGDEAEYAVIVSDNWQQKALGFMLSMICFKLAERLNIKVINTESLRENFPMLRILNQCNFKVRNIERNMVQMSLAV